MNSSCRNHLVVALFFILVAIVWSLASCKNESGSKVNKYHRDTTKAFVLHLGYGNRYIDYGPADRITLDTLVWVGKDSTTQKKEWQRITYYLVNLKAQTDSIIAAYYKIPEFDSTGKHYSITIQGQPYPAEYVRDTVTNFDSAVNQLKRLIVTDTTNKK